MTAYFECRTRAAMPPHILFDRARSIDVHKESLAKSKEKAVAGITSGLINLGEEVTWRAWHFGLPFRMTSRITEMEYPQYFIDEQVRGPFNTFRHVHKFQRENDGTMMIDEIEFEAPFGALGRLTARLVLKPYLQDLIQSRNHFLVSAPTSNF